MTDYIIYSGEDFALLMSAFKDDGQTPEDLTDYDLTAQLSTTTLGTKLVASTEEGSEIQIFRKDISNLAVNIRHTLTFRLSEGVLTLTVLLTHRPTGTQLVAEVKTIEIKRSKLAL